jgi:predicted transcriptional regulator
MVMITGAQIRMARGYAKLSAKNFAEVAGVAESTIKRMEATDGVPQSSGTNLEKVQNAIERLGIALVHQNGGGAGVRMRDPVKINDDAATE